MASHQPIMMITGASSGIGRAAALHFAAKGWIVFGTVRKQQDAESLEASHLAAARAGTVVAGGRLEAVVLDITIEASLKDALSKVAAKCGPAGLTVLINNAGVAIYGPLETTLADSWRYVLETNVIGLATITRHCLPLLRLAAAAPGKGPGARIINIGSAAGKVAGPLQSVYSASKHAVEAVTDSLRAELAPQKIQVVLMQLGAVATSLAGKMATNAPGVSAAAPTTAGGTDAGSTEVAAEYAPQMAEVRELFNSLEFSSIPIQVVLSSLDKAVLTSRPATRYAVDGQIGLTLWIRWLLPDRLWDRFYAWATTFAIKKADAARRKKK